MLNMKSILAVITILFCANYFGQDLVERESILLSYLDDLRIAKDNKEKAEKNEIFKAYLKETIEMEGAFDYPFSNLKTLGSVKSPDNKIRLFNWNVEQDDMSQKYYCYILKFDDRKKDYKLIELIDNSDKFFGRPSQSEIIEAENWYGALYYKIIPVDKGSKTIYTVIGYDANTSFSSIKLLDVFTFSGNTVRLGSPIFRTPDETFKRVFYEHSKKTTMFMNFEEDRNRIIFDHLSPETPQMKGMYSFYVPDLSYDAFVLEKNKWMLQEDVIGVNKHEDEKITIQVLNENNELVEKKIKNKWEDPSDSKAPGGGSVHVATTPDETDGSKTENEGKSKKNRKKKYKNQPKSYNPVGGYQP